VISFTPVRQSDAILEMHLAGLDAQGFDESWFYDDNDEPSLLLSDRKVLPQVELPDREGYGRGAVQHDWPAGAVARVAEIKNRALAKFYRSDHEWIFLIDSDVLIPAGFVNHLLELRMPIVSGVYWSDWGDGLRPNVWDYHPYWAVGDWEKFREPSDHIVGGLGACTLVHRSAVEAGVNFKPVRGVQFAGEDRHFCIRASAADIPLIACSHFDLFHVYHDRQIEEARAWLSSSLSPAT
jgi:hypothetical protein